MMETLELDHILEQRDSALEVARVANHCSDDGMAALLYAEYPGLIFFCEERWEIYVYEEGIHRHDKSLKRLTHLAKEVQAKYYIPAAFTAAKLVQELKDSGAREDEIKAAEARSRKLHRFADAIDDDPRKQRIEGSVMKDKRFSAQSEQFNWADDKLPALNGVIDLRTGALLPHDPSYMWTFQVPHRYDPSLDPEQAAANFLRNFRAFQPDAANRRSIELIIGQSLTGDHSRQFWFHHGLGSNFKSCTEEAIAGVLGNEFALKLDNDYYIAKRNDKDAAAKSENFFMHDKRMTRASEPPANRAFNESVIKADSDQTLKGKKMRHDYVDVRLKNTPWMSSNYVPTIHGTENGFWDRFKIVPWPVRIDDLGIERNENFFNEVIRPELAGCLVYFVRCAMEYYANGQRVTLSPLIEEASEQCRLEMDSYRQWIKSEVRFDPNARTKVARVWESVKQYEPHLHKGTKTEWMKRLRGDYNVTVTPNAVQQHDGTRSLMFLGLHLNNEPEEC